MSANEMTPDAALALRKPFPPESIGRLPKGGAMLDYAGHAAVTDRLLTVDPAWSWEPLALGPDGLPALDRAGNLWIRLTICGVTRLGVGDGKNAKELIGDAIRNAAMRFGVALDLWAKENLVEFAQAAYAGHLDKGDAPSEPAPEPAPTRRMSRPAKATDGALTERTRGHMFALFSDMGLTTKEAQMPGIVDVIGRPIESRSELTEAEGVKVVDALRALKSGRERDAEMGVQS